MHDDAPPAQAKLARLRTTLPRRWRGLSLLFFCTLLAPADSPRAADFGEAELREISDRASAAFERGDYRDAVGLYERLTRVRTARDQYWLNYGATLTELGRVKEGIAAYRRAIRVRGPLVLAAALGLAEAYRRDGDTGRARLTLGWLVKQRGVPPHLLSEALALSARVDETNRTKEEFDELVNIGIWRYKNKRWVEAYSAWNGALQIRRSWEVFFLVALARIEMGEVEDARRILADIEASSEDKDLQEAARAIRRDILSVKQTKFYTNVEAETGYASRAYEDVRSPTAHVLGQARLGYRFFELDEWRLYCRFRGKFHKLFSPVSNTLITQNVGGALGYDTGNWLLELKLDFELNHFPDELFLFRVLTGWSVARRWQRARLALSVVGSTNTVAADAYDYLSGKSGIAKLAWTYLFFDRALMEFYGRYGVDDVGDSDLGPGSFVPVANVEHETGQTLRLGIGPFVTLKEGFALGRRRYLKNSDPGGSRRRDTRLTANLGLSFRQSLHWTYDLDLLYLRNNSNVNAASASDQRFSEYAVKFNMLWDLIP